MKLSRPYLILFNPIYWLVVFLRNLFFDLGIFKSTFFNLPIIAVGNLSAGGTGKTPHTEYIIKLLKDKKRIAVLSRGYGRSSVGYQEATSTPDAQRIGDEPAQIKSKFLEITVAVDADRVNGVRKLLAKKNQPEVIVLDDAFQHRKLQAGFYVLLTSYNHLFIDDWVLPAGNLREQRSGYSRAHAIIVTKCPADLSLKSQKEIALRIKSKTHQRIYFSAISYAMPQPESAGFKFEKPFVLITGIADANPLLTQLKEQNATFEHLNFADHYRFEAKDIEKIIETTKNNHCKQILTTEKDFQRLDLNALYEAKIKVSYLPISIQFLDDAHGFDTQILDYVSSYE